MKAWVAALFLFGLLVPHAVLAAGEAGDGEAADAAAAAAAAGSTTTALQEKEEAYAHPLTNLPPPNPNVLTGFVLPEHADKKMAAGEVVKLLCAFANTGDKALNVSFIMASLNAPHDFGIFVENYTGIAYNRVVPAGEQGTFSYMFSPNPNLDPRDFVIAATVFYEDLEGEKFASTFFNSTIDIVEATTEFDSKTWFLYVLIAAFVSLVLFIVWKAMSSATKKKIGRATGGGKARKVEMGTSSKADAVNNEWLQGTNVVLQKRATTPTRAKAAAKKEK
eukprot:tig00000923_g5467.t1